MTEQNALEKTSGKYNDNLITLAFDEIKNIYYKKTHETVYTLGECILRHFYAGDIENIRNNTPTDGKSLNKLTRECEANIEGLSRAWLYASSNLLVDRYDMKDCSEYQQLSVSHKFHLLQIHDIEKKISFAIQIFKDDLSVRKTIELLSQYLIEHDTGDNKDSGKKTRRKTLRSLIKQPHLLASPEYKDTKSNDAIQALKGEEKKSILDDAEIQLENIEKSLEKNKIGKQQLESLIKKLKAE